jgi:HAD superfamily hydrolase (TIGR01509 family)
MPLRALLFDFDGVLADTENVHVAAWQRTLADLGWEVPDEVCARAAEEDDRAFLADLFARRRIEDGDVEGWVRRKQALTIAMLNDSPRLYPGVADLVRTLQGRVRLAVVSGTWRGNVEAVLRSSGLADAFTLIVGKEDVKAVKPDPECYRLALRRLKVAAADAVALEDSPTGLAAARGAKLRVLAVGHRRPPGDWVGKAEYIPDLTQPAKVLEILGLGSSSND